MNVQSMLKVLNVVLALALALSGFAALTPAQPVEAAGGLSLTIVAAPNLVVDSNALSPSTYAPKVATVIAKICNTTGSAINNVTAYIGNYTANTPGVYPSRTNPTVGGLTYRGTYAFTHLGGAADGTRFLGNVPANTCVYQYWSFEYPHLAVNDANGNTIPTWGVDVKPTDDLWLTFDMWVTGNGGTAYDNKSHIMTMRNEISAMANKIKPNGNPAGEWFNTDTSVIYPGQTIKTNGILYRLGNINQGFDNGVDTDGNGIVDYYDGVPDYNAWLQPFGDPSYDPSCFRLIGVTGTLTVTRSSGNPDMIIPIDNNLYFTNLPPDNTDVRGEVFYEFLAIRGACTVPISPYQEVASGSDNEKFNGDYGTGVPSLMSYEPEIILDKTGNPTVAEPGTITYQMPFYNDSDKADAGLTLTSGGVYAPLMIQDMVPEGLQYVCGSAEVINREPSTLGYEILYSKDSGATWGAETTIWPACSTTGAYVDPDSGKRIAIRFILTEPLPKKTGSPAPGATARFQARVPGTYSSSGGSPLIENCATASFGDAAPFAEACANTLVEGTGSIGDRVWADDVVRDGAQTTGELGISGVKVSLYYDKNGDGKLDSGDVWLKDQDTSGTGAANYDFTLLPAGKYIVEVDATDAQLPTGYTLTTAGYYAVTLGAGQDYNDADFGFAPTLDVQKSLVTPNPAVVGETVTFKIQLTNQLPGSGTATGGCVYYVWPNTMGTGEFTNPAYAAGAPDGVYATVDLATGKTAYLTGSAFNSGGRTSNITSVEAVTRLYFGAAFNDDVLNFQMTGGPSTWAPGNYTVSELNIFAPGEGYVGYLYSKAPIPGANAPGGSWDWPDFNTALVLSLNHIKNAGPEKTTASINVDALGFRVTTDDTSCVGAETTIAVLPLTDTYQSAYLTFVSAEPPYTTHDSSTGTLYWENLGPLYAGGTRTITVTFTAKATVAAPGTLNEAEVTGAKFGSGRAVNDDSDDASVSINASGSISGRVFGDNHNTGTWVAGAGYSASDTFIPGVEVELWACVDSSGQIIDAPKSTNKPCTDSSNGGSWVKVTTQLTGLDGSYAFAGLRDGYYNVIVNTGTLPTGFTTNSVETTAAGNGAGGAGGDSQWNLPAANLNTFNNIVNGVSGEHVTVVSFGYRDDGNNQGAVVGYVWHDLDGDGVWDTDEQPISGVPVYLCTTTPCNASTPGAVLATTDANGRYTYGNLPPGSYYVGVTAPNGMSQSGDPDQPGAACTTCDNQTTTAFTVVANGVSGPYNFGYTGGYKIGDMIYTDRNGDGDPDDGEEGIGGVKVRLYRDVDGDGVVDPEDTLLDTYDTLYNIIDGKLDINNDGVVDSNDDKPLLNGYRIIDGMVDINGIGGITGDDDGTFMGYTVIDGLIDVNGGGVDSTDDAGKLGFYEFANLPGNGADYLVLVDSGTLPAGYVQTADRDSVKDNKTVVELIDASVDNADFGYQPRGYSSIGDYVWNDANGNGVQDSYESGINGVTVNLYQDQDGDGVIDSEDALVATTLTGIVVKDGYIDIDGDGSITGDDDSPALLGIRVIDGKLDINNDGVVNTLDAGTFSGYTVVDGLLDMNGVGGVTTDDDGVLDGLYQFRNLPAGNYIVEIPDSNFESSGALYSLLQTYDQDTSTFASFDNQDKVTLGANENYTSGDFGYANSSIGDLVWQDSNGDGLWENGEPGIGGVWMELYLDADNNGVADGAAIRTTQTLYNIINGYLDLDNDGVTDGDTGDTGTLTLDGVEYTITNGKVYFGGNLYTGTLVGYTMIGGMFDVNGNGSVTGDDDANTLGLYLFGGLGPNNYLVKVESTDNFAAGGALYGYTLTGDPNSYNSTPGETSLSCLTSGAQECDGVNWLKKIVVENKTDPVTYTEFPGLQLGQNDMSSDFGYQPPALIGDRIWQDLDGDGVQDPGEPGIAGVLINLYADANDDGVPDGGVIAIATTNDEGYYYFQGQAAGNYVVEVAASNFNAGQPLNGYTQTGDPEGNNDNQGDADTTGNVSDLSNDFGYQGDRLISGTLFFDKGTLGGIYVTGDQPFSGVQVYLYNSAGKLVGSTFTDNNGDYQFKVPSGVYEVRVAESLSTKIKGMTPTYEPGEEGDDGYCETGSFTDCDNIATVDVTLGNKTDQDFGFFARVDMGDLPTSYNKTLMGEEGPMHIGPASNNPTIYLGAYWDAELDGNPDANAGMGAAGGDDNDDTTNDEDGVDFLNVWKQGGEAQLKFIVTNNDTNNYKPYLVGWFDWDNSGDLYGRGEMAISQAIDCLPDASPCEVYINVPIPSNAYVGLINMRFRIYATQSPPAVIAPTGTMLNGEVEDYQRNNTPTAVTLAAFAAAPQDDAILVTWETGSELDNLGFNLYRSETAEGPYVRLNATLMPPQNPGMMTGAAYIWLDENVLPDVTYYYKLQDIDVKGVSTFHGPVSTVVVNAPTAVQVQSVGAHATLAPAALGLAMLVGLVFLRRRRREG